MMFVCVSMYHIVSQYDDVSMCEDINYLGHNTHRGSFSSAAQESHFQGTAPLITPRQRHESKHITNKQTNTPNTNKQERNKIK